MTSGISGRLLLVLALLAQLPQSQADDTRVWRGNFIIGQKGPQMSPCFRATRLQVLDATPGTTLEAAYRELSERPGRPIFIEFTGTLHSARVHAHALRRANSGIVGCQEVLRNIRLRAYGLDPYWRMDMRADAVHIKRRGDTDVLVFPALALKQRDGGWHYEGANRHGVLSVVVREAPCFDQRAPARFTLRAQVRLGADSFGGCAYWGELAPGAAVQPR